MGTPRIDAVVVGAGAAGLAAALELQGAGLEVFVVDPADRPGGVMRTDHLSGFVVERGPNTFQVKPPMLAFLERRGLADALVPAQPAQKKRWLVREGALVPVPSSPLALVRSPLLSPGGKLRLLAEPFVRRGNGVEETVAEFVDRRLGAEATRALVGPFLTGIYAGDEQQLGAGTVFAALVDLERRYGSIALGGLAGAFRRRGPRGRPGTWSTTSGLGPFARRMADQLAEPPALGSRVARIARDGSRWRVDVTSASEDLGLDAARVVLAAPAADAAQVLHGLDAELAATLAEIAYAPIVGIPVAVDPEQVATPIEGFGFLVPREEGLDLLGCLYMSRLFPGRAPEGRALLQCLVGGVRGPDAVHRPDDELAARLLEELDRVLGLRAEPEVLGLVRWPRAVPQPGRDHVARVAWLRRRLAETPGLTLAGSYLEGVGVADTVASGVAAAAAVRG